MNIKTVSQFVEKSNIPESLIRAVIRQSGGWQDFPSTARDVCEGGASGGFHGFVYYRDTIPFANRNKAAILELAKQQAEDFGAPLYKMIGDFNCLKISEGDAAEAIHNPRSENRDNVLNALAWYALEEVARNYLDIKECS